MCSTGATAYTSRAPVFTVSRTPQASRTLLAERRRARARQQQMDLFQLGACQRRAASNTRSIRQRLQAQRQLTRQTIATMPRRVSSCLWVVTITSTCIAVCSAWMVATPLRFRTRTSGAVSKNSLRGGSRGNPPPWVDFIRYNLIDIFWDCCAL